MICNGCGKETNTADGCDIYAVEIDGKFYDRLKFGDDNNYDYADDDGRCPDCGVKIGFYHHIGCGIEVCPRCENLADSCSCTRSGKIKIHAKTGTIIKNIRYNK